jgi:hypothetical protein
MQYVQIPYFYIVFVLTGITMLVGFRPALAQGGCGITIAKVAPGVGDGVSVDLVDLLDFL